jgi:signal transduction histidine kinase
VGVFFGAVTQRHFYLTPVLGGPGAPRYPISDSTQLIGRSEQAIISLLEPTVSREHASIQIRDGGIFLEDLGSKHGTFVNSKRIKSTRLKVGDIVVFGLSLVLRLEDSAEPVQSPEVAEPALPDATHNQPKVGIPRRPTMENRPRMSRPTAMSATQESERLKHQLVRSRKLAAIGALSTTVIPKVHSGLLNLAASMEKGGDQAQLKQTLSSVIEEVGELLQFYHHQPPKLKETALFDIVRRAVSAVKPEAEARQVELLLGVPVHLQVEADPARLLSGVSELLRLAAAVSPVGTSVEINASVVGPAVELRVVDQGPGIAPDAVQRLFDPLATLRQDWGPFGLGLFEVRQVVASMGGTVEIESEEGRGTTYVIRLRATA